MTVEAVIKNAKKYWGRIIYQVAQDKGQYHKANLLMLDCSKAMKILQWQPVWDFNTTLERTINWYKRFYEDQQLSTDTDLEDFIAVAKEKKMV